MAVASKTINWDNVNTFTRDRLMPKVVDQIFNSNPLFMKLFKKGSKLQGGTFISQPLIYGEGPSGFFQGVDTLDTSDEAQFTTATFDWKEAYASIVIRTRDERLNSGSTAFGRLLTNRTRVAQKSLQNLLGQGVYSDGTTNPKSITGLRAMVTGSGVVYGGISKTTNSWWRSQVDSSTTAITRSAFQVMQQDCTEGADTPDLVTTTKAEFSALYALYEDRQRYGQVDLLRAGFRNLVVNGIPVVVDSHCPDGYMYFLNTDYIDLVTHTDDNFRFSGFKEPVNQRARVGYIFWMGNLTASSCRFQGVFTALND